MKDIRESFHHFPREMFTRIKQIYEAHQLVIETALSNISSISTHVPAVDLDSTIIKSRSDYTNNYPKIKKFLEDACMYVPSVQSSFKKGQKIYQPTSSFIPLKKKKQSAVQEMVRKEWKNYIKLPII